MLKNNFFCIISFYDENIAHHPIKIPCAFKTSLSFFSYIYSKSYVVFSVSNEKIDIDIMDGIGVIDITC